MSTLTLPRLAAGAGTSGPAGTPWRTVAALTTVLALAVGVLLAAFAWPATHTWPRDLPIAVAGPAPAVEQVRAALGHAQPGAFAVHPVPDAATARQQVRDRTADGALVLDPAGPRVVVATQGSPLVAQALTSVAAASAGAAVRVDDVAPAAPGDPHGAGLAAGTLPVALAAVGTGVLVLLRVRGTARRGAAALGTALLGGLVAATVLHTWLGALSGSWPAEAGVLALGLAAGSLAVLGLAAVAGRPGVALGAVLVVVLGNPLSAAAAAPDLLPRGWSQLGQLLPPGAVVAALRAVSGFGGTGAAGPVTVLAVWVAGGLALLSAGAWHRRAGRHEAVPA
jgi:hypothetical protein